MSNGLDPKLNSFVNLIHRASTSSTVRRGMTEGVLVTAAPLTVRLDGTTGPVSCKRVNGATPAAGARVLVWEEGAGARYVIGAIAP